ncbi:LOW QUALITY PROTEIN: hypothetical protein MC885_018267 [Smutsia gigantea]|nr:LOW QUALITY PROTEIN: hypothetical protein MC885_018267 [Smutsia gigantea]
MPPTSRPSRGRSFLPAAPHVQSRGHEFTPGHVLSPSWQELGFRKSACVGGCGPRAPRSFPAGMSGTTPDQERTPASEPVWERPWSVEEIRRSSQSWSLAADAGVRGWPQGREGRAGRLGWRPVCEREDGASIPSTGAPLLLVLTIPSLPRKLHGGGRARPRPAAQTPSSLPGLGFLALHPSPS